MNTHIFYCIPLTFPDDIDLCVLICSGFIRWYNGCFPCCLYSAPLSVYTILHDGKYFITDFCTEWNIIIVTWINRSGLFISSFTYYHFTFSIFIIRKKGMQESWFCRNMLTIIPFLVPHFILQVKFDSPLHSGVRTFSSCQ